MLLDVIKKRLPLILALATEYALMVCLNNMRCMQMTGSGLRFSGVEGRC